jgi:multidrug efflux system outer membrane protein
MMIAVLLVVLVLAAQYESWSLPMAIVLIVPMCVLAALFGVWISHFPPFAQPGDLNIFTQVALVVLVGLACKNAILIVEFAKELEERGDKMLDAIIHACRMRLRPILMTSIAFCAGVLPLIFGSGAGSEMRRAMGIAVFSGMLGVTLFGIFLTPVFYVLLRGRHPKCRAGHGPAAKGGARRRPPCRRRSRRRRCSRRETAMRDAAGRRLAPLAGSLLLAALAGCAVGPNYQAPAVPLDASFVGAGTSNAQAPGADIAVFWRGFADPLLTQLVERALAANGDVRIASARLQEARATLGGVEAELLPEIGVAAGAGRSLTPEFQLPGASRSQRTVSSFDAAFTASWELDFFGRNRRASESAAAGVAASEAGVHAAQTAIAAEVARNYLELRGLQQRFEVARESLVNQRDTLRLTTVPSRRRPRHAPRRRARAEPVRQHRGDLAGAAGSDRPRRVPPRDLDGAAAARCRPAARTAAAAADFAGHRPLGLAARHARGAAAPPPRSGRRRAPARGGDGEHRRRHRRALSARQPDRPDRLREQPPHRPRLARLAAVFARRGLSWPLLDFGRVRSRIAASEARAAQALAGYEQTVGIALEETEGALSQFTQSARQAERLASAARNAEEATRLSRLRFDAGVIDFVVVLDAQRQSLFARDQLVQAQVGQATALVAIYRALGGGWTDAAPAADLARR